MLRFVINLDRSKDRLDAITRKLDALGIDFQRVPAVDGSKISEEQKKELLYPIDHFETKVRFTRELTNGEIGCFLSHRECWKRLLDSDEKWALIMEDDIQISKRAAEYMKTDAWIPQEVEVCQFSALDDEIKGRITNRPIVKIDGFLRLVEPLYPTPLGMQCYCISRVAAEEALKTSVKLAAPVDDFLFSPWFDFCKKHVLYRTSPLLVVPNKDFDTDIGNRSKKYVKKAPFWIRHGLRRVLMDREVKKYQKAGLDFIFKFDE